MQIRLKNSELGLQVQFTTLLNHCEFLADQLKLDSLNQIKKKISIFRAHLYDDYFSHGWQLIYSLVKKQLEAIILALFDPQIPLHTRQAQLSILLEDFDVCSGGIANNVLAVYSVLCCSDDEAYYVKLALKTIAYWLAKDYTSSNTHTLNTLVLLVREELGIDVLYEPYMLEVEAPEAIKKKLAATWHQPELFDNKLLKKLSPYLIKSLELNPWVKGDFKEYKHHLMKILSPKKIADTLAALLEEKVEQIFARYKGEECASQLRNLPFLNHIDQNLLYFLIEAAASKRASILSALFFERLTATGYFDSEEIELVLTSNRMELNVLHSSSQTHIYYQEADGRILAIYSGEEVLTSIGALDKINCPHMRKFFLHMKPDSLESLMQLNQLIKKGLYRGKLLTAVYKNDLITLKEGLEKGKSAKCHEFERRSLLYLAAFWGYEDIIDELNKHSEVNQDSLLLDPKVTVYPIDIARQKKHSTRVLMKLFALFPGDDKESKLRWYKLFDYAVRHNDIEFLERITTVIPKAILSNCLEKAIRHYYKATAYPANHKELNKILTLCEQHEIEVPFASITRSDSQDLKRIFINFLVQKYPVLFALNLTSFLRRPLYNFIFIKEDLTLAQAALKCPLLRIRQIEDAIMLVDFGRVDCTDYCLYLWMILYVNNPFYWKNKMPSVFFDKASQWLLINNKFDSLMECLITNNPELFRTYPVEVFKDLQRLFRSNPPRRPFEISAHNILNENQLMMLSDFYCSLKKTNRPAAQSLRETVFKVFFTAVDACNEPTEAKIKHLEKSKHLPMWSTSPYKIINFFSSALEVEKINQKISLLLAKSDEYQANEKAMTP